MRFSEKNLVAACAAMSIVGIALLFLLASASQPPEVQNLQDMKGSGKVRFSGIIMSVAVKGSHTDLRIAGLQQADAVSFDSMEIASLGLERFQAVEITGEVRQFNGANSIIISKIKNLGSLCNYTLEGESG